MMIIGTIKKYATLIKWGGIAILVAGILYSVYDYSQSKERLDQMEDQNSELIDKLENLETNIENQTKQITQIRNNYNEIELKYSQQLERLNELRNFTSNYVIQNRPEIQKELNIRFDAIQSGIQCASGNKSKCLE